MNSRRLTMLSRSLTNHCIERSFAHINRALVQRLAGAARAQAGSPQKLYWAWLAGEDDADAIHVGWRLCPGGGPTRPRWCASRSILSHKGREWEGTPSVSAPHMHNGVVALRP
jgi:hypothetical protein